jgi:Zn-dependent peptidase ImmA (M78 family)
MILPERLVSLSWNNRVLTRDDFYDICEADNISVVDFSGCDAKGCYTLIDGRPFIFLNGQLHSAVRRIVGWHELGHHLLHAPGMSFYCSRSKKKAEYEAERFAACALLPLPLLSAHTLPELEEEYGYPRDFIRFRSQVFRDNGI